MLLRREKVLFAKFDVPPDIKDRHYMVGDEKVVAYDKKGNRITLKEHKELYPYYLNNTVECIIVTTVREIRFTIKKGYVWNGADIPKIVWSVVGSQHNPEFRQASMVHDYMLEYKWLIYVPPLSNEISVAEFRRLTSLAFRQYLKNDNVGTVKSNFMSGMVQWFQSVINRKEWRQNENKGLL